ncbi:MAG: phosphate/phosphite/phosphonate ABC transporter substrate-binding protein [Candidatus Electrothrix sp. AR4]|nr:phosphate/phosphite/phosphonate ABC transporter substrate-binding protein [Candidatus Electrothrix sp. AR4]
MKGIIMTVLALLLVFTAPNLAASENIEEIRIGILSWRGPLGFKHRWEAAAKYLTKEIGRPVVILPLEFQDVLPSVEAGKVDFFTADPSVFMTAKVQYGATEVLTMKFSNADSVGAVLFTAANNRTVNELKELKDKKFGALRRWSFGGWQMAEKEFLDSGIDPYPFLHTLRFFDTPQSVVRAVLLRKVDAGTVPASILERMATAGTVKMEDFKILEQKFHVDFPYVCSTELYPGFPLAKTAAVDQELADQVATALKALHPNDSILRDARVTGWIDPLDYTGIKLVQAQLRGGGYTGERR